MDIVGKVSQGVKFLTIAKVIEQLLRWVITFFIIRILSPEDYGLMAVAMSIIGFSLLFNEGGLGLAIIQNDKVKNKDIQYCHGFVIVMNLLMAILLLLLSPFLEEWFEIPQLEKVLSLLTLVFVFTGYSVIPLSILQRGLKFKKIAVINTLSGLLSSIGSYFLAVYGFSVYALIWGVLINCLVKAFLFNYIVGYIRPLVGIKKIGYLFRFGLYTSAQKITWWVYSNFDVLIIGKFLNANVLGLYNIAMELAKLPETKIAETVNQVSFSSFSNIKSDKNQLNYYLLQSISMLSFVVFPVFFGLSVCAEGLVLTVLGEKWAGSIELIQIFALIMPFRVMLLPMFTLLNAIGRVDVGLKVRMLIIISISIGVILGVQYGIFGVTLGWVAGYSFSFFIVVQRVFKTISLSIKELLSSIWVFIFSSAVMWAGVFYFKENYGDILAGWPMLLSQIGLGGVLYFLIVVLLNKKIIKSIVKFIRL